MARMCIEIGRNYGHSMRLLDLGGGFPAGDISEDLYKSLKVTQNDPLNYRVMAEPGRHFCSNFFYLSTRIMGKRIKHGRLCYHINEGLYHGFNNFSMDGASLERSENQFYTYMSTENNNNNKL